MANIRDYDNKENIKPSSEGADAIAQGAYYSGRAIAGVGDSIGSAIGYVGRVGADLYKQHVVQPDISEGMAIAATVQAKITDAWNQRIKNGDINDPELAQKFNAEIVEPEMQKFKDSMRTAEGQEWAQGEVGRFREHLLTKTRADMATAAGYAAQTNLYTTYGQLSNMVASDPTSLTHAKDMASASLETYLKMHPNIDPDTAAKMRADLAIKGNEKLETAAVYGLANSGNFEAAEKMLKSGKLTSIDGDEAMKYVRQMQAWDKQLQTATREETDRNRKAAMAVSINNATLSVIQPDGKLAITPEYMNAIKTAASEDPDADPGLIRSAIDFGVKIQERAKDEIIMTDPVVEKELSARLFDPVKPTTLEDVLRASAQKKISDPTMARLQKLVTQLREEPIKDPSYKEAMKAAEASLTYAVFGLPGKDPKGVVANSTFQQVFMEKYLAAIRADKLEPNALNLQDPTSMISQTLAQYKRSDMQMLQDRTSELEAATAVAPPEQITVQGQKLPEGTKISDRLDPKSIPSNLKGNSALQWSASRNGYYDPMTKTWYNKDGSKQ